MKTFWISFVLTILVIKVVWKSLEKFFKLKRKEYTSFRVYGLRMMYTISKACLESEELHYGLFKHPIQLNLNSFKQAQENYREYIVSHVPGNIHTILDVGAGTGTISRRLLEQKYIVNQVSPDPFFTERIRANLTGYKHRIYETPFEKISIKKQYDLIIFAESFQYIPLQEGLKKVLQLLSPEGYVIICDSFKKSKTQYLGGHVLKNFEQTIEQYPLNRIQEEDITQYTAPTHELLNHFIQEGFIPNLEMMNTYLQKKYVGYDYLLKKKVKKKLDKLRKDKLLKPFEETHTYKLLLYQQIKNG